MTDEKKITKLDKWYHKFVWLFTLFVGHKFSSLYFSVARQKDQWRKRNCVNSLVGKLIYSLIKMKIHIFIDGKFMPSIFHWATEGEKNRQLNLDKKYHHHGNHEILCTVTWLTCRQLVQQKKGTALLQTRMHFYYSFFLPRIASLQTILDMAICADNTDKKN